MISTTFYVASCLAITSLMSVSFFEETVLRPIRSGPRKVSAGLVVSAFKSTIILILAADEAASIFLSNDASAPSTDGHIHDAVPTVPRPLGTVCPACELYQGTPGRHPPVNFVTPVPAQKFLLPFQPSSSSSSPVFRSTAPCDITTPDLPNLANCKRLSITSDTTTVACDDDRLRDVLLPFPLHSSSPVLESTPCDNTTTPDLPNLANCKRLSITSDTTTVACDDDRLRDVLLPSQLHSSSPVLESTPCDNTTTPDLPNLATCNQLSITSDTTLVASDNDSKDVFSDNENYATLHPEVRAPAHTTNDDCVDVPIPNTTIDIISPFCTPYIRPLVILVDKCQITPTSITNHSIPGSAHLTDAFLQATETAKSIHSSPSVVPNDDFIHSEDVFIGTDEVLDTNNVETLAPRTPALTADNALVIENSLSIDNTFPIENALTIRNHDTPAHPSKLRSLALLDSFRRSLSMNTETNHSGSTHPTDALSRKTETTPSWLKPLILVNKYAAGRPIPLPPTALSYQPEKSRPLKLKEQKRKFMVAQMNAACPSIVRSQHANRIVDHLAQVCEHIRVDKANFMDAWVTDMAEVGLISMLDSNHQTSPGSTHPSTFDAHSILEPGSRIKARLASLRHRTNAVVATIPATTTTTTLPPPLPR